MAIRSQGGRNRQLDKISSSGASLREQFSRFSDPSLKRAVSRPSGFTRSDNLRRQNKANEPNIAFNEEVDRRRAGIALSINEQNRNQFYQGAGSSGVADFRSILDQTRLGIDNGVQAESEALRGVEQEFAGTRQREIRELSRLGVSPTSGRGRGASQRRALTLALARSGARLESRKSTDELNLERERISREQAITLRGQDISQAGQRTSRASAIANIGGAEGQRRAGELLGIYQPQFSFDEGTTFGASIAARGGQFNRSGAERAFVRR